MINEIFDILACPFCVGSLEKINTGVRCNNCRTEYLYTTSDSLDLRLKKQKKYQLDFELQTELLPKAGFPFEPLSENLTPEVDFSTINIPFHLDKKILSYFPKAKSQDSLMLDLGCGTTIHREVCELSGFRYVGLDYHSPQAEILGDAHSLPFKDSSFEFILSIAVLEHLRFPFVAIREAYRVLKFGGKFIGTVAFLEPYHEKSFYHYTHLGVFNMLKFGRFIIEKIAPSENWSVLSANAKMGLFPKMPLFLSKSIVLPVEMLHKFWLKMGVIFGKKNINAHLCNTTGAFTFIAHKQ